MDHDRGDGGRGGTVRHAHGPLHASPQQQSKATFASSSAAASNDTRFVQHRSKTAKKSAKATKSHPAPATPVASSRVAPTTYEGKQHPPDRPDQTRRSSTKAKPQPTALDKKIMRLRDHVRMNAADQAIIDILARVQRSFRSRAKERDPNVNQKFLRTFDCGKAADRCSIARTIRDWFSDHKNPISNQEFKYRLTHFCIVVPEPTAPLEREGVYDLQVLNLAGQLDAINVWHLFHGLLDLELTGLENAPLGTDGITDPTLWNITIKSKGCPPALFKKTKIVWGDETLWLHHKAHYARPPCTKCGHTNHTARRCKTPGTTSAARVVVVDGPQMDVSVEVAAAAHVTRETVERFLAEIETTLLARSARLAGRKLPCVTEKDTTYTLTLNLEVLGPETLRLHLLGRAKASQWIVQDQEPRALDELSSAQLQDSSTVECVPVDGAAQRNIEPRSRRSRLVWNAPKKYFNWSHCCCGCACSDPTTTYGSPTSSRIAWIRRPWKNQSIVQRPRNFWCGKRYSCSCVSPIAMVSKNRLAVSPEVWQHQIQIAARSRVHINTAHEKSVAKNEAPGADELGF